MCRSIRERFGSIHFMSLLARKKRAVVSYFVTITLLFIILRFSLLMRFKAGFTLCESVLPLDMNLKLWESPSVKFTLVGDRFIYINMKFLINIETWKICLSETYPVPSLLVRSEWTQWTKEQFRHFWWRHHLWRHRRRSRSYRWPICTGWPRVSI